MLKIRDMTHTDVPEVRKMMRVFYASPAVLSNGSDEIFDNDINACLANDCPYLSGLVFEWDGSIAGYSMLAHSFSTEFGKPCVWVEDIYIKPEYRGKGIGTAFFKFIEQKYQGHLLRLEAERENAPAVRLYEKCGFDELPYLEMIKQL